MSRALVVIGTSVGLGIAVLALLLAAASVAFRRPDAVALYGVVSAGSFAGVTWLLRRDHRAHPRPVTRVPRAPIRLPLRGAALTFVSWYVVAVVVTALVEGGHIEWFHLAAIAPFASFMLTMLTFAGRHIAFRLTKEEEGP